MKKPRVLLVDDDRWFAESLRASLPEWQIGLIFNADDIFPALTQFRPDILILDLVLYGKNAVTFLNEFASYDDMQNLQVWVLSSVAKELGAENLKQFGVHKVLDKAEFTPQVLRELLS
jgi:DNA-binding response OmpR family regulator